MVKHLLLIASLSMAVSARADDPPDAYRAHYPPHYFFGFNAPPAPSAQGRFGFDSGEDRGFGGQYLREENYEHSHGLNGAQAECSDPSACPCPSPYYRNSLLVAGFADFLGGKNSVRSRPST
jgi:hypothetical protein